MEKKKRREREERREVREWVPGRREGKDTSLLLRGQQKEGGETSLKARGESLSLSNKVVLEKLLVLIFVPS
jgi:hypothetical protein